MSSDGTDVCVGLSLQSFSDNLTSLQRAKSSELELIKNSSAKTSSDWSHRMAVLGRELAIAGEWINNLDHSFQQTLKAHMRFTGVLKSFQGMVSQEILDRSIKAFSVGDIISMDESLEEIGQSSERLEAASLHLRGEIAEGQIDLQKAFDLFRQAISSKPDNSTYLDSAGSIAHDLAQYETAIEYYKRALKIDLDAFGEAHPQVAARYNNLGVSLDALGRYEDSIQCYEKTLASDLVSFGEEHPNIASDCNNLGSSWKAKGDYDKAVSYYERALACDLNSFGEAHPQVATNHNNLGGVWHDKGDFDKAIGYYEKALDSDVKFFGKDHPQVSTCYNNLGSAWQDKGDYDKARGYYTKALNIFAESLGDHHPNTMIVRENLRFIEGLEGVTPIS